jgi:hypothetical protein
MFILSHNAKRRLHMRMIYAPLSPTTILYAPSHAFDAKTNHGDEKKGCVMNNRTAVVPNGACCCRDVCVYVCRREKHA